ncbi:MAG: ABC transporter permease [Alphaproteobacteria bacterium]|nr:ABC transporter permease [Alphaproteobacteria bacterium]MBU1559611.1 ABC transporter permease [Alphaproteobacteria bacterium]MBU2304390.1 ABC transporter permease [Alphaproteobacteria bacterium]MBU2367175.1 ABC transporter permease [Alphaproteobacteria bacterium]
MANDLGVSAPRVATARSGFFEFVRKRAGISGLFVVLLLLAVTASLISDAFLNPFNLVNVLRQVALYGIVSIGLTFVILTAGIDLSVGSIVAVISVLTATMLNAGVPIPMVVLAGLGLGLMFGLINGVGITLVRIPPFIMTLGTMVMLRGLALTLADGRPIDVASTAADFSWIGRGSALGLPIAVWIFIVVALVSLFVLRFTPFGRNVYAVGSNAEAAHLSGINVELTKIGVYSLSGFLAALTALIFVSRLTVGEPTAGTGLELEAIAIAVIGGTSLFGGQGGIVGTAIGACILAILANIMNLVGISPFTQQIVKGAIIIIAVSMEVFRRRR